MENRVDQLEADRRRLEKILLDMVNIHAPLYAEGELTRGAEIVRKAKKELGYYGHYYFSDSEY